MREVAEGIEELHALAERRRDQLRRWWVLIYRGLMAAFDGRFGEAEQLADDAATWGRRLGQPAADAYRLGQLSRIYWSTGRLPLLEGEVTDGIGRFPGLVTLRCIRALVLASSGRQDEAVREARCLVDDDFAILPRDSLFLASLALLAETVVVCGNGDLAPPLLETLAPFAGRNLIQGVPIGWGAVAWYLARLSWIAGQPGSARRYAERADRLHARWGSSGMPHALSGMWAQPTARPLSRREREVAGLLASGKSNAEIAEALYVSVHTVERHVANIFLKVGVHNRAEAAVWAHHRGMAG